MTLQQELCVLLTAVAVHTAAGMTCSLVTLVELVVVFTEAQAHFARHQSRMLLERTALAAIRFEVGDAQADRHAFTAGAAVRTVGEYATAAKAGADQFAVGVVVDQMRRRRDLRACDTTRQVGTAIGRRGIKVQQGKGREVAQVGHA